MANKSVKPGKRQAQAKKPAGRKSRVLSKEERELREQAAMDTSKSDVENYLDGGGDHFRM
jgi:hypothetical protein